MNSSNVMMSTERTYQNWIPGWLTRKRYPSLKLVKNRFKGWGETTGKMLASVDHMPAQALLLGRCQDGLPLFMDMSNPDLGAILIGGDPGSGKTHHIQALVDTATRTHSPHELQIAILTHKPDEWDLLLNTGHARRYFQSCHAWYDKRAEKVIHSLYEMAERRREGHNEGPSIILVLDDLNFIDNLSFEAQVELHWLLAYGAQSDIWLVGAINAGLASRYRFWMETFRTRIIGRIRSIGHLRDVTLQDEVRMRILEPSTFRVWTGRDWMTYQIPLLGD